jgi:cellulose synthase/poly-beta-1,6-N-acetylglucosamine synthase-like glycosyltransferase
MRAELSRIIALIDLSILVYFLALNTLYLAFCLVAYVRLRAYRRRWTARDLDTVVHSPATPGISLVAPAHNEEATLAESVRSLLMLNYPLFEVIVVSDGSTDGTLAAAMREFELVRAPVTHAQPIATEPIRAVYRSVAHPDLLLIDKDNGGKSDAINAGINAARHPIVCVIDADSLLETHALSRAVLPFIDDPDTIAAGGIVRIANGCRVERGRVTAVRLPDSRLAMFQTVEYLRSFLAGRVAHSAVNALLIVSGAFGLFRRDAIVEAGGFLRDTIGEDMEMIVRLHRIYRNRGQRFRIAFQPDPVCWTQAPESARMLGRQRNRWQRGTLQVLWRHRGMLFNPRYGVVGLFALPYYLVFEAAGPLIELTGYVLTAIGLGFGLLDVRFAELFFLAAVVYGSLLSVAAVALEELSFRRYPRLADLFRLAAYGILENFGYRQLGAWWRLMGIVDYVRNRRAWGAMARQRFTAT